MNKQAFFRSEFVIILASVLVAVAMYWPLRRKMTANVAQAEAQMYLSQIATLERAYFVENGHYVGFDWYGAPVRGEDHCARPDGAEDLGFKLRWCERRMPGTELLYAYQVEAVAGDEGQSPAFRARAVVGTDAAGTNRVCPDGKSVEAWEIDESKTLRRTSVCP